MRVPLIALALAGCGADARVPVEIGGFGLDVAALVIVGEDGQIRSVSPTFAAPSGSPPSARIEPGEEAYVVGAQRATLLRVVPAAQRGDIADVRFEHAPPPGAPATSIADGQRVHRFRLPDDATIVDATLDPGPRRLLDELTALWPVPLGEDVGGQALHAFGDGPTLFTTETPIPGLGTGSEPVYRVIRVIPLDGDRLLFATERFVGLLDRGRPFDPGPGRMLGRRELEPGGFAIADVALDATRTRGWIAGTLTSSTGKVHTFTIEEGGTLRATGSATITPGPMFDDIPPLRSLLVDRRGYVLLGGENGTLYVAAPGTSRFEPRFRIRSQRPHWFHRGDNVLAEISEMALNSDPVEPHLIGTDSGTVIAGDAVTDAWSLWIDTVEFQTLLMLPHVTGIAHDPDTGDTWVSTRGAGLVRKRPGQPWARVPLAAPIALQSCATPGGDGVLTYPLTLGVVLDTTHAYVPITRCNGLLRVRRDDEVSAAILPVGESSARFVTHGEPRGITHGPRGPILAGERGLIVEAR